MKKISLYLSKAWEFVKRHKYLITILIFAIHMIFLSEYSLITRIKNRITIAQLKSEIEEYNREYKKNSDILENLDNESAYVERIAREQYYMKKDNEDIFIIKNDK